LCSTHSCTFQVVFAYHDFPTCGRHGPIPLSRAKGCLKAFELMVYMACCPGIAKRAAQLLAHTALCVAASWIELCDPPTNIGSGAARSRALLPPYNLDNFTYQINYAHPLRYYNLITLYYIHWSLSLRMPSSGDGDTSTSSTTGMELLKDTYAEGHLHPSVQQ